MFISFLFLLFILNPNSFFQRRLPPPSTTNFFFYNGPEHYRFIPSPPIQPMWNNGGEQSGYQDSWTSQQQSLTEFLANNMIVHLVCCWVFFFIYNTHTHPRVNAKKNKNNTPYIKKKQEEAYCSFNIFFGLRFKKKIYLNFLKYIYIFFLWGANRICWFEDQRWNKHRQKQVWIDFSFFYK